MGGVHLGEEKKWGGEYTLAAEGRGIMSNPTQGVFGTFPKKLKYRIASVSS